MIQWSIDKIVHLRRLASEAVRISLPWPKKLYAAVFCLLVGYVFCLPQKLFDVPYSTIVLDRRGELLGARIADDGQWRFPPSDTVPEKFKICLTAFEDRYFQYHWGVNPLAVARAIRQNILNGRIVSGGSTITMQLIRLSRGNKRTMLEKAIEMTLATRLEFRCSKDEILALYASHAPFGGNVAGLEAAAWRYFGHSPTQLSWAEAAVLAVLPNAPSMLHPSKNRQALLTKRNKLLKRLLDAHTINELTYELAISEPLPGEPLPLPQIAPHLVANYYLTRNGKKTVSTVDCGVQTRVESILSRWNGEFVRSGVRNLAAIVVDIEMNQVIAYCGNVGFSSGASGSQVDVIRAPRSSGSILKPFLYCAALQEGELLPDMLLPDIPININGFSPQNFDRQFSGAVLASEALARSLNVPAVQLLRTYSVPKFYNFLKKAGITTLTKPASHYGLSLILGGAETSLWDVASVYCLMARTMLGMNDAPFTTDFSTPNMRNAQPVFHSGAVWQTFEVIKGVNRPEEIDWQVIPSMQPVAWKTGTSYGFRDGWAVGTTSKYLVGVWVGNASGEGVSGLTGARTAGPVMFDIFNIMPSSSWFLTPYDDLTEVEVCRQTGHLKGRFCTDADTALVAVNALRTATCPYHRQISISDDGHRVYADCAGDSGIKLVSWFVLPPAWEWYYRQHHPEYQPLPSYSPKCADGSDSPMQFIYPQRNITISLPKQLDGSNGSVVFELAHSNSNAKVYWHLDNDYVETTQYFHRLSLTPTPGKHTVTVVDDAGNTLSTTLRVEN
ncbi:MAG: penicillin-binding protein 1C [Bacteroidales bacterium]|jgi:penicillin-binding protein 1C|nr:penicillin-binding protein 1C [Bacteroidales bacterium]